MTSSARTTIIITGMHRSGTSLTASLLQSAGVEIGDRLMAGNSANARGYFEDLDFVEFHERILSEQSIHVAGWSDRQQIEVSPEHHSVAQDLLVARQDKVIWGWKDPRTTLFLDFWSQLLPGARYVFVFRSPWAVLDSLFRRGDAIFRHNPNFALTQWCNYNRAILDFLQRYPERCLLFELERLAIDANLAIDTLNQKWNLNLEFPAELFQPSLLQEDDYYRQITLERFFPHVIDLYHQLQQRAVANVAPTAPPNNFNYPARVLQDWSDLSRAKTKLKQELKPQPNHREILIAQKKIEKLENLIRAMESSKFWRLRNEWQALKQKLNLKQNDRLYQDRVADRGSYDVEVYTGKTVSLVKWLKQNFPQKAALKRLIWTAKSLLPAPPSVAPEDPAQSHDPIYQRWLNLHYPQPAKLNKIATACQKLAYQPLISIIVPIYNPDANFLRQAIESVLRQTYSNWELCLADDCSTKAYVAEILAEYEQDSRIKVVLRPTNGHISQASNSALELATGEYIALLDHDDLLAPHALSSVVELLNRHPEADFIYSDEDKVDAQNIHSDPYFKPDWSPDSFLSRMYTCHLGVYRRSLVNKVGNFRPGFEGSQDYDLVLRVTEQTDQIYHITDVLYHWRIHSQSTAAFADAKTYAVEAGQKAISEAIARRGEPGKAIAKSRFPGVYTVRYQIKHKKLVSIIIPTKDLADTLDICLQSIFNKTSYDNYEVIVIDNGSTEAKTFQCLEHWEQSEPERFRYYRYDIPFNYSKINNYAVEQAQGDYLLFLNNDTEVITVDWLEAAIEQCQRESIGAVGGLLLYPDNTIQHAGVILGINGTAGHSHRNFDASEPGYISQIVSTNNYSAVTAACLMCRREVFERAGGFDPQLAVALNDVDFCLKLVKLGYYNVYLPHLVLYHYESQSRGYEDNPDKQARYSREIDYLKQKWSVFSDRDPYYNPNLSREHEDYRLRQE